MGWHNRGACDHQRSLPLLSAQPPPKGQPHPFSLISLPLLSQGWTRRSEPLRCWQELGDLEAGSVWLACSLIRKGSRGSLGLGQLTPPQVLPWYHVRSQGTNHMTASDSAKGPVQPSIRKTEPDQEHPDSGSELAGMGCRQVLPCPVLQVEKEGRRLCEVHFFKRKMDSLPLK